MSTSLSENKLDYEYFVQLHSETLSTDLFLPIVRVQTPLSCEGRRILQFAILQRVQYFYFVVDHDMYNLPF
jgi:hypothetical protein